MNRLESIRHWLVLLILLSACTLSSDAYAQSRRFDPSPRSNSQLVQVLNEKMIISEAGTQISAGASMASASIRKVSLSVSVKNTSAAPLDFIDGSIQVMSAGETLRLRNIGSPAKDVEGDGYMLDRCVNATRSSQMNCTIDSFNQRQRKRIEAAQHRLAPGELSVQQFQIDLPRKNHASPTILTVSVTAGGEQLSFDFREFD